MLDLGKDLQSFTEKLTSLLTGNEIITYPKEASLIAPVRFWVFLLGLFAALGFTTSMILWRDGQTAMDRTARTIANAGTAAMLGFTFLLAAFWSFGWQPALAVHLSSKGLFERYDELRKSEPLVIMGDLGYAAKAYTDAAIESVTSREQIVTALKRKGRVFAIAPQAELCSLHREMADQPYFVLEDRNLRNLLLSNQVEEDTEDKNPLREMIAHKEPTQISHRPKARIVFENKIELLGWDMPDKLERGDDFEIVTYWKILTPVGGAWTMLMHFDGPLRLRDGDHKPIKDRCPTSSWQPGDFIIDRHPMKTSGGNFPAGKYDLWIGFFTGSAPNFRNMPISLAPGDMRDTTDRAKITSLILE